MLAANVYAGVAPGEIFKPDFVAAVSTAALTINGVAEMVKRGLKLEGLAVYALTLVIAVFVNLPQLGTGIDYYVLLTLLSWLQANGIYKMVVKR